MSLAAQNEAQFKKWAEKLKSATDTAEIEQGLEALSALQTNPALLGATKIGVCVNRLSQRQDLSEKLRKDAANLVAKWRQMAENAKAKALARQEEERRKREQQAAQAAAAKAKPLYTEHHYAGPKVDEGQPDIVRNRRNKARALIWKELMNGATDETRQKIPPDSPIPEEIEGELEKQWHEDKTSDKYLWGSQLRAICSNLKDPKNPDLNARLANGELHGRFLARMTSEEMASKERQIEREKIMREMLEEKESDWNKKRMKAKGDGQFTCFKCKSSKTNYTQAQTRSSDEPMTTFVECLNCGNRWKC
uniref:TFIIS-type domain-containing protein n=1 Tax=Chromera velia CCMP2878 TaxID=1169474 RepID=A0A0G4HY61_9ALVE|eukprot:Cvel_9418.t1-p1 / transcript=Cvel_9418.t1 / gene=Cvel_9418 / organism=Chromera_velia_CCMP2878 / gene_product=Transcription elongation factor A protein 1, putative / transcript_product=Transcription elongation factor A protein 1, putative / location=Cvel_scaffold542:55260-58219(-) / protein_length=306 / sequence_SO=supercontig / SO=protein_coding / is_pseudo=false